MPDVVPRHLNVRENVAAIPKRTYATHSVDRYPAKMVPHLARFAIDGCTKKGDVILDPFCGCGTVPIESIITGRASVGVDVNPVAVFLARAKTAFYDPKILEAHCSHVIHEATLFAKAEMRTPLWLNYWFSPVTLSKLWALREAIYAMRNQMGRNYFEVLRGCLVVTVRRCSRADPRSPKPFISCRAREIRVGRHFDPFVELTRTVHRFVRAGKGLRGLVSGAPQSCKLNIADSRNASNVIAQHSVDAVVTSPPYLTAQDYFRSSKLELAVLGMWRDDTRSTLGPSIIGSGRGRVPVGTPNSFAKDLDGLEELRTRNARAAAVARLYIEDMSKVFGQLVRLLKPSGRCVFVVGDSTICGNRLPVHKWFIEIAMDHGFQLKDHVVDAIRDRRVPPKRLGHKGVIEQEHMLFFAVASKNALGRARR